MSALRLSEQRDKHRNQCKGDRTLLALLTAGSRPHKRDRDEWPIAYLGVRGLGGASRLTNELPYGLKDPLEGRRSRSPDVRGPDCW